MRPNCSEGVVGWRRSDNNLAAITQELSQAWDREFASILRCGNLDREWMQSPKCAPEHAVAAKLGLGPGLVENLCGERRLVLR